MTRKTSVAAIAAFITVIAGSAYAGDQNTNTLLRDSGRYVPQVNEPARVPADAFALSGNSVHASVVPVRDFQLEGR